MLGFALFGAGRAGAIHAQNISNHANAELVLVYDINLVAAERLVSSFGGQLARNPDDIWESTAVDIVLIASSTETYVDLLRGAMRANKPTYCEKPIDQNIDKVRQVVREARDIDFPIFMGFRRRFLEDFQLMRQALRDGALGRIETIRVVARDHRPPSMEYVKISGGLLRDKMIHYFDLVPWLAGEQANEVYATGSCIIKPAIGAVGDVDTAVVILRFPSGLLATIENNRRAVYGMDERIEIFGEKGMLQSSPAPVNRLLHHKETGIVQGHYSTLYAQESFAGALGACICAVESGAVVSPSLQDVFQAQLIAEAASQSLQENQPVAICYTL